jgi:hypothetical protein
VAWYKRHDEKKKKTTPKCFIVSTLSKINLIKKKNKGFEGKIYLLKIQFKFGTKTLE